MSGVSNERNDHSGLYTEEELRAREEERINRHVNKEAPKQVTRVVPKEETGPNFVFRLVGLPGPGVALVYADGEEIFRVLGGGWTCAVCPF